MTTITCFSLQAVCLRFDERTGAILLFAPTFSSLLRQAACVVHWLCYESPANDGAKFEFKWSPDFPFLGLPVYKYLGCISTIIVKQGYLQ